MSKQKHNQLKVVLDKLAEKKMLVIGDVMLDHFIWGDVSRISPEAPVPIVQITSESIMPGGAANVSKNLTSLGLKTPIIGYYGDDTEGKTLVNLFEESQIETDGLVKTNLRTTKKTRIIAHNQQVVRVDRDPRDKYTDSDHADLHEKLEKIIPKVDGVIIEDYGKGVIDQDVINKTISLCKKYKVFCAFDPKMGNYFNISGCDLCTPNKPEAVDLAKRFHINLNNIEKDGQLLREKLDVKNLLITLGGEGMILLRKNQPAYRIATKAREVYDVSGAGDTVISTFTSSIVAGASPEVAAELANIAGGIVVGKLGTATVTRDEILDFLKK